MEINQFVDTTVSHTALSQFMRELQSVGTQLHAIEIFEKGSCVVRWAVSPYSCTDKREMYSLSKSVTATAVGVAFDKGLLTPKDTVLSYFPEYAALCNEDERWTRMQLSHVLSMSTGHAECVMPKVAFAEDGLHAFFTSKLAHEPGTFFAYNTAATYLLAEIVYRATGDTVPQLLAKNVFSEIGINDFKWQVCADGRCQGGTGLYLSCDDIAKLGQLYLNNGVCNGKQVLSSDWVQIASSKHSSNENNGTEDWCKGYGYQFWLNAKDGYRGDGAFGQLCVVLPKTQRVIAIIAECEDMYLEVNALWNLLDHLYDKDETTQAGVGLQKSYAPKSQQPLKPYDSGWMKCLPNSSHFTGLRVKSDAQKAELWLCDAQGMQHMCAPASMWKENVFYLRDYYPLLKGLIPHNENQPLCLAAAASTYKGAIVFECRSLSNPHAFTMRFTANDNRSVIQFVSPLAVFKNNTVLEAEPLFEK